MTKKQRNILDDLIEGARRFYEELDLLLNPEKREERAKVPVPIPVEPENDPRNHDPYDHR